ncbi:histidinol-phosphate transaminase [Legionella sp. MW5194]|uniref:histidinol-phosphate transaminase n=1 Tax=Legionella sp. MW5194 TaxID=2662448 RepID=UPI00193D7504|nr:histidinol-phosphate transaminase [Legionella sp. MW5194]QRN03309.1 histidinol-phosphate transaminase [Legionella sp. MW5194]
MPCDYHLLPHEGIRSLSPYVPGKSIDELAKEKGLDNIIKLASNENPLGCSHLVKEALAKLTGIQLATYPSLIHHPLRAALAEKLGIKEPMLAFSNGSDTLFSLLLMLFALHQDKHMLTHAHAFVSYSIQAKILGIPVVISPVGENYEVDIDRMINLCNDQTAIVFLANPNNPTGLFIPLDDVKRLLHALPETTILVLDEAYYEFAYPRGDKSSLNLLNEYPNLVITRTFSKVYGLAALRLGYVMANPAIIDMLLRIQPPFAVNQAVLEAGYAAIHDLDFVTQTLITNAQGMQQMEKGLKGLNLQVLPSKGNFISFDCGMSSLPIYEGLLNQGVIVRPLVSFGLPNHLRVTIGTMQQNIRFLNALSTCLHDHRKELEHEK